MLTLLLLAGLVMSPARAISVDLHSHLFMKDGMGFALRGDFDEPTGATDARSFLRTKMTRASLGPSGLRLIVVSFYAHPILSQGLPREALLRQIDRVEKFTAENPEWVIAGEPAEARAALAAGKKVFVLSLETAASFVESDADQDLFIERKKIRIVTFMHLSPDALGRGVSLWPGIGFLNSPLENIEAWIRRSLDPDTGAHVNPHGLSAHGKTVLEALARRRVWIDLAHSSDRTIREMTETLDRYGQPTLFTHGRLREFALNERAIPAFALERMRATHGMLGLVPSDDMGGELPPGPGLSETCRKGIRNYALEWKRATTLAGGAEAVTIGSDFNAPLHGLRGCEAIPEPRLARDGFYRGEDLPLLTGAMRALGIDPEPDPARTLEHFLSAWEKVRGFKESPRKTKQSP